jgi:hypothetical protein
MKIIFLDVDGVLNSVRSMIAWYPEYKASWTNYGGQDSGVLRNHIDPMAVKLLNRLTDLNPDLKYVISSSHRIGRSLEELQDHIASLGITGEVIDMTGRDPKGHRGNEIRDWMADWAGEWGVVNYAILDDDSDMTEAQKLYHFVHTDNEYGFSYKNYKQLVELLQLTERD